jgi:hypothetical protein
MTLPFCLTPLNVEQYWPTSAEDLQVLEQQITPAGRGTGPLGQAYAWATGSLPPASTDLNMCGALQIILLAIPPFADCNSANGEIQALHDSVPRLFRCRNRLALVEGLADTLLAYVIYYQAYTNAALRDALEVEQMLARMERLLAPALFQQLQSHRVDTSSVPRRRVHRLSDCWQVVRDQVLTFSSTSHQPWPKRQERVRLLEGMVQAFDQYGPRWPYLDSLGNFIFCV